MKQGRMIILEPDREYARRLAEYFNVSDWMPFEAEFFSDSEELLDYIKRAEPDLLLVNERLLKEEFTEYSLLVLCETLMIAEMDSPQIYKYQSAREIGKEVISWYASQSKRSGLFVRNRKLTVTGVYSLDRKREKSMFSWEIAKFYGKKGKTLYLSLEAYSAMEQYLGAFSGEGLSDYLFCLRQGRGNIGFRLQGMTERIGGVDILPPSRAQEDISDIRKEDWRQLIQVIEEETEYSYLVLDISEAAGDFEFWLDVCSRMIMPVGEDFYSQSRSREMREFIGKRVAKEAMEKWILCPLGGWSSYREYAGEEHPEMEEFLERLIP